MYAALSSEPVAMNLAHGLIVAETGRDGLEWEENLCTHLNVTNRVMITFRWGRLICLTEKCYTCLF